MTTTTDLANFVYHLRFDDLPAEVIDHTKAIVINSIGVQLAASTLPWSRTIYRFIRSQGGTEQSTIVNYGHRTTAPNAAFANGSFAHGFEMDENHGPSGLKGGCVGVPTAFAIGEHRMDSGRDVLTAFVAGYEIMARLALAARKGMSNEGGGHHTTGCTGSLGAAAIAGKLMGLLPDTLVNALGCAITSLNGLQNDGPSGPGHVKRTYGGAAAFSGIRAALLAAEGLGAADTFLEADSGFSRAFAMEAKDIEVITSELGDRFEILRAKFKLFAQDGHIQPITECLERICRSNKFAVGDIARVRVGTHRIACEEVIGTNRDPRTLIEAQYSANFSVALYLVKRSAGFADYSETNLIDPTIRQLAERVFLEVDDEIETMWNESRPRAAKVTIELQSGERLYEFVKDLRVATAHDIDQKFLGLAQVVLPDKACEQLLDRLRCLEDVRDVATLFPAMIVPSTRRRGRSSRPGTQ